MDQCSYRHDIPSALQATSPNRPGHDLAVGGHDVVDACPEPRSWWLAARSTVRPVVVVVDVPDGYCG